MGYMKPKKRQKLCYHCEGEVDLDVIVCPFCAADLREERSESRSPPPSSVAKVFGEEEEMPPLLEEKEEKEKESDLEGNPWLSISFFVVGVQLLLFGLFSFLFSHQGKVVLSWDASYWFLYCLIGGPLFYFGYKKL
ncbi:MAG: hypothetical protein HY324_02350 [Chlamydiia bacterium]|nr:hypothetical protein [Chlamydiia bacterium]